MDVKDLMVGDWVLVPVIGRMEPDSIRYFQSREGVIITNHGVERLISQCEPIPLTPEILEKNFEKKIFYGMYDDFFDLEIREYYEGVYAVTYHYCEFPQADQIVLVSFIHELQHTLRLLNIEKEIVL